MVTSQDQRLGADSASAEYSLQTESESEQKKKNKRLTKIKKKKKSKSKSKSKLKDKSVEGEDHNTTSSFREAVRVAASKIHTAGRREASSTGWRGRNEPI